MQQIQKIKKQQYRFKSEYQKSQNTKKIKEKKSALVRTFPPTPALSFRASPGFGGNVMRHQLRDLKRICNKICKKETNLLLK
jgi:hypothetical protein